MQPWFSKPRVYRERLQEPDRISVMISSWFLLFPDKQTHTESWSLRYDISRRSQTSCLQLLFSITFKRFFSDYTNHVVTLEALHFAGLSLCSYYLRDSVHKLCVSIVLISLYAKKLYTELYDFLLACMSEPQSHIWRITFSLASTFAAQFFNLF